jgi:D-serine deaminase-like pyridoxal phosphate-dependent protein
VGRVAHEANGHWVLDEAALLTGVSQEHGLVKLPRALLEAVAIGDLIFIVPAHACLAVQSTCNYRTWQGDTFRAWS